MIFMKKYLRGDVSKINEKNVDSVPNRVVQTDWIFLMVTDSHRQALHRERLNFPQKVKIKVDILRQTWKQTYLHEKITKRWFYSSYFGWCLRAIFKKFIPSSWVFKIPELKLRHFWEKKCTLPPILDMVPNFLVFF